MTFKKTAEKKKDIISVAEAITLPGLLQRRIERTPDLPAYHQFDAKEEKWITRTWQEIGNRVARWQRGLQQEAVDQGDRVAILLANLVDWVCFEQAALALGLVVVPLYTWDSPENIAYLLQDSGCRLLLVGTDAQWLKLAPLSSTFPDLTRVLCLEDNSPRQMPGISISSVRKWLSKTRDRLRIYPNDPNSLATIVYTSGTTGPPKGVMLSHKNILWNAHAILEVIECYSSDILLSFLPLSHTFERTAGYYTPMMVGCSVAYSRSIENLAEDLKTIRPTIIISVPRIYEKVYAKVKKQLEKKNLLARWLFKRTLAIGWQCFVAEQGKGATLSYGQQVQHQMLRRLVAGKILKRLGGRIRFAVSGGAPLHESVTRFFLSLGLRLIQGYGLTEAAPVVSTNTPEHNIPASVGPPLPDVQYRIGHDNELLVKSPGVMAGYWNMPKETSQVIDSEGWLHTGDVIEVKNNDIYIKGRLKEIIVTSTGEKVAPADLEMNILADPLFDNAMVVGEGKPYLAALLVLRRGEWDKIAKHLDLDPNDSASLDMEVAKKTVMERIKYVLHDFPSYAQIHAVALLLVTWSIANGMLTPTLKIKRDAIEKRYFDTINQLYTGHDLPSE